MMHESKAFYVSINDGLTWQERGVERLEGEQIESALLGPCRIGRSLSRQLLHGDG